MTFANWGCERALQCDVVTLYAVDGLVGDDGAAVFEAWGYVDGFPFDWYL